jgi:hypothetical protein
VLGVAQRPDGDRAGLGLALPVGQHDRGGPAQRLQDGLGDGPGRVALALEVDGLRQRRDARVPQPDGRHIEGERRGGQAARRPVVAVYVVDEPNQDS